MIKKYFYKRGDRKGWIKLRRSFVQKGMIGGSDVATILHANPYRSAIELFYTAVGFTPESNMLNEKMMWGTELEDRIADMYQYYDMEDGDIIDAYEKGVQINSIRRVNAIATNDKYPYLFANVDRLLPDINGIGEIKNTSSFVIKAYTDNDPHLLFVRCPNGVPVGYYAQIQSYMMVYEKDFGRLIFLVDGSKLAVYEVEKDVYLQQEIQAASEDFYNRVQLGLKIMKKYKREEERLQYLSEIEPEVTDQSCYNAFRSQQLQQIEDHRKDTTIMGDQELLDRGMEYLSLSDKEKVIKAKKTLISNEFKAYLFSKAAETIDFGEDGKISYKKKLSINLKRDE